jgi:hypothetical protein
MTAVPPAEGEVRACAAWQRRMYGVTQAIRIRRRQSLEVCQSWIAILFRAFST